MTASASRRAFLRAAAGLAAATRLPGATPLALPTALQLAGLGALAGATVPASSATADDGYRALVCLFMAGGNDSHNWVVPIDTTGHAQYTSARRELALGTTRLASIGNGGQAAGRQFGMPHELQPLRQWYLQGQAAVVANVGPLLRPTTMLDYLGGAPLPRNLYSHNDQQSTWQALQPEGAPTGWGGRLGDALMSANAQPTFTCITATGQAVFLAGQRVTPFAVTADGPSGAAATGRTWLHGSSVAPTMLPTAMTAADTHPLQAEYARSVQRALAAQGTLKAALQGTAVPALSATPITLGSSAAVTPSTDPLARQLRMVAALIQAGQALGMRRQVFMVQMGGFDTHTNQMRDQPTLMARVALGVDGFMASLQGLGLLQRVMLFTASEFGRTLVSNGSGSDHGWGSHHFVAGGGVKGGRIHGTLPTVALGAEADVGSGRMLPTTSVTELAAPLGRWLGVADTDLAAALPGLEYFDRNRLQIV